MAPMFVVERHPSVRRIVSASNLTASFYGLRVHSFRGRIVPRFANSVNTYPDPFSVIYANSILIEEGTGFLPRVNTCSDGSFCCDNNPNCCADHEGVVLNGSGEVVSTDSLSISATSTTSTSATSSPTSTTSNTPTTSSNSKATPSPTKSASTSQNAISTPTIDADSKLPAPTTQVSHTSANALSTAAAAGIGVGAGLAVILLASAIVYFLLHRRRIQRLETELAARDRAAETAEITVANPKSFAQVYQPYQPYRPSPAIGSAASELPALGPQDRAFELPALDREPRRTSYKIPLRSPLHRF
ncbi:hypothetical protein MMC06_001433 [Schaereria dolodes]|nr:hypothetical protein [Schaereria dolodes]